VLLTREQRKRGKHKKKEKKKKKKKDKYLLHGHNRKEGLPEKAKGEKIPIYPWGWLEQ